MKHAALTFLGFALLAWATQAQTSAEVQANESSSAAASAAARKTNAQAQTGAAASLGTSANAGSGSIELQDSTTVNAALQGSLDSRKNRPGDPVVAEVTKDVKQDGHIILRKGTRLIGHVTEAQARARGQAESSLGIAFDHARMKKGEEVPLQLGIRAIASAQAASSAALDDDGVAGGAMGAASGGGRASGGLLGGAGSAVGGGAVSAAGDLGHTVGGTANTATGAAGSVAGQAGGLDAAGQLTSSSTGVFGFRGMSLESNLSNATQGSLVTSTGKVVQLSAGTQFLLRSAVGSGISSNPGKQGVPGGKQAGSAGKQDGSGSRKTTQQ